MKHLLPPLKFNSKELEPFISERTIEFHYGKHHQAYVDNLNKLIIGSEFENATLEEIIKKASGGIFNNGAQVWNHTFYFDQFSSNPKKRPEGKLFEKIEQTFGAFETFIEKINEACLTLFGSGWGWLIIDNDNNLQIMQTSNAGNPLRDGFIPLLTIDVWEHAYYLDYQNRRAEYLKNIWNILDWNVIENRFNNITLKT
ncbi:MAG: superoxide dismutase [Bacteroidales bacterium]|nr:superoxide dismutase [Bacteroidales bacterium]